MKGIYNVNVIWFYNYNRSPGRGDRSKLIGIINAKVIGVWFRVWFICLEI